jgi:hypothetical protein
MIPSQPDLAITVKRGGLQLWETLPPPFTKLTYIWLRVEVHLNNLW